MSCGGNKRLAGDRVTTGAVEVPVPVRFNVCVPALSVIVRLPVAEPAPVGLNETRIVQEWPGTILALQLFVWEKGAAAVTVATCMGPLPTFSSTTLWAALVVLRTCAGNTTLPGAT